MGPVTNFKQLFTSKLKNGKLHWRVFPRQAFPALPNVLGERPETYPVREHLKGLPLRKHWINIGQCWKCLPGTNSLACLAHLFVMKNVL
jgi:hypothetical protein